MLHRIRTMLPCSLENKSDIVAFLCLAGCISLVQVSVAASQILLFPALIASWNLVRSRKSVLRSMRGVLIPLVLFCVWTVLAACIAQDKGLAFMATRKFYMLLLVPLVPVITIGDKKLSWIYKAIFPVALLSAIIGIIQYILKPDKHNLLDRITGSMSTWMTYSGLLMLALVLLTAYGLHVRPKKAILWIPAAAIMALTIVLSLTRSSVLGAYIGICVILILMVCIEKRKRFIVLFIGMILFPFILYCIAPNSIQQRFHSAFDPEDPNTHNRIVLYSTSIRIIRDNPWFGVGPDNVKTEALKYRNENEFPKYLYQHMHNNCLQITAEIGLPGLLFWLWFMVRLVWDSLRVYRYGQTALFPLNQSGTKETVVAASAALGVWAALMTAGMFEYNFGDSEVLTLFLFLVSAPYAYLSVIFKSDQQAIQDS